MSTPSEKISQLPVAGGLIGTELIPIVQAGVTSDTTPNGILAYVLAHFTGSSSAVSYSNALSGLTAAQVQAAIDEIINQRIAPYELLSSQFNLRGDNSTDNIAFINNWTTEAAALIAGGQPVSMVWTPGQYRTTGRHMFPGAADLICKAASVIAIGSDLTAPLITHGGFGASLGIITAGTVRDLQVLNNVSHKYTNRNFIGFRALNKIGAYMHVRAVSGFTIGVQFAADELCAYNIVDIGSIVACPTEAELCSLTVGTPFVSENEIRGGNISATSSINNYGSGSAVVVTREYDTGYAGNSGNFWEKPSDQMQGPNLSWAASTLLVAGNRYYGPLSGGEWFCKVGGTSGTVEPSVIPSGANLVAVTPITTTVNSAVVTMVSTAGLSNGMHMRGYNPLSCFPFDTYIQNVDSGTQLTLTNVAATSSVIFRAYFIALTTDNAATLFYVGPYMRSALWHRNCGNQNAVFNARRETGVGPAVVNSGPYLFPQAATGTQTYDSEVTLEGVAITTAPDCRFPVWSTNGTGGGTYALGDMVRPLVLGSVFWEVIAAGAPGGSEPVPSSNNVGTTFTDSGVTWIVRAMPTTASRGEIGFYTGDQREPRVYVETYKQAQGPTAVLDNLHLRALGSASGWLVQGACKNVTGGTISQSFATGDLALSREGLLLLSTTSQLGVLIKTAQQKYFRIRKCFGAYSSQRGHLMPYDKAFVKLNATSAQYAYNNRIYTNMSLTGAFEYADPADTIVSPTNILVGPDVPYVFFGVVKGSSGTPVACALSALEVTALAYGVGIEIASLQAQIYAPRGMNYGPRASLGTPTIGFIQSLGEPITNASAVAGNTTPGRFIVTTAGILAPAWVTGTTYVRGQLLSNSGNVYAANGSFTSGSAPTTTGRNIVDSTASAIVSGDVPTWDFIDVVGAVTNDANVP